MKIHLKNTAFLLLLAAILALPGLVVAKGPPIRVEQAIPGEAVQGQRNLGVKIKGKGFGSDATVRFLVAGTDDDAQIDVTSVVYDTATGDLDTIINVNETAIISGYDIEVQRSGGRGGKGTDLFRVQSQTGGGHSTLSAEFCLTMNDMDPGLGSDGKGEYCHSKKDRIIAGTGAGAGFRFDTNISRQPPRRTVSVKFPPTPDKLYDDSGNFLTDLLSTGYEIDLRFNKTHGGLDLGTLNENNSVGYVPIDVWLVSSDGFDSLAMAYGGENINPLADHGYLKGNLCVHNYTEDAKVTWISDEVWTVETNPTDADACLWDKNSDLRIQEGTVVNMPFKFTITIID